MAFADIRQGVYNWARNETGLVVIWAEQSEARTPRPYIALKLTGGPRKKGHDDLRQPSSGVFEIHGQREWTCSVNVIGSGAMDTIAQLQTSLEKPTVIDALAAKGLGVIRMDDARDLSLPLDTGFESRAQMDVVFSAVDIRSDAPGHIEDVSGVNEIDGKPFLVDT